MVSSFGLHHRNERTLRELMRIHPDEHPVSIQLFGHDAEVMRSAAEVAAEAGADLIDINMGCPVPQGAEDRRRRRAARRPRAGPGAGPRRDRGPRPAGHGEAALRPARRRSLRLRPRDPPRRGGRRRGDRLPPAAGATVGHKGKPDYELTRELAERLEVPVIVSGGLEERRGRPPRLPRVGRRRGDDRPRRARQPLGLRGADRPPRRAAVARRGRRRAALDDGPRRGAPRHRARDPLPAQVLPLVHGARWARRRRSPQELQRSADLPRAGS